MAKSLKLKNNKYWDIDSITKDDILLSNYLQNNYMSKSIISAGLVGYGKNGADASNGYRLILQATLKTWTNYREILAFTSRHLGTGFYIIALNTASTLDIYNSEVKFYGSTLDTVANDPFTVYYDNTTGIVRVLIHYADYSPPFITRFTPLTSNVANIGFGNMTWYDSLPSNIGTALSITKV